MAGLNTLGRIAQCTVLNENHFEKSATALQKAHFNLLFPNSKKVLLSFSPLTEKDGPLIWMYDSNHVSSGNAIIRTCRVCWPLRSTRPYALRSYIDCAVAYSEFNFLCSSVFLLLFKKGKSPARPILFNFQDSFFYSLLSDLSLYQVKWGKGSLDSIKGWGNPD